MSNVTLMGWADSGKFDLILTTGIPRDVTPEAPLRVVEKVIPGFGEVMRAKSLAGTPCETFPCR